ncbi:MAG: uroporphyrinogen-III C-methyltransferase [Gemmataceae bacterium]
MALWRGVVVDWQTRVFLVGGGPGNPGLLTLRAVECLTQADLVVYDRLANSSLLDHAPPKADKVCVTELAGHHAERCQPIHDLMIAAAKQGKRVVRLKGGDPLVFGRGAEEAEALREAGIPFEIVPGITAGLGAAAFAGIPLSHRLHASAVAFVAGHECSGKESSAIDWNALVHFPGTLVVYMGMSRLESIVDSLLKAGKDPATPAAAVHAATTGEQRTVSSTLQELPGVVRGANLTAPSVILIGSVVSLRGRLNWFEKQPLFGKRILVTRPRQQAGDLARRLEILGAKALILPTVVVSDPPDWNKVDAALSKLNKYHWVVFTSANGVNSLIKRLWETGRDLRVLGHLRLAAIGPATAQALRGYHLEPDVVPAQFRSEALAADLLQYVVGKRVLLARADRGRELLREELAKVAEVDQVAVYSQVDRVDMQSTEMECLRRGEVDYVTLTSSNIAKALLLALDEPTRALFQTSQIKIVTISPVTTSAVQERGLPVGAEATDYTSNGIVEALIRLEGTASKK